MSSLLTEGRFPAAVAELQGARDAACAEAAVESILSWLAVLLSHVEADMLTVDRCGGTGSVRPLCGRGVADSFGFTSHSMQRSHTVHLTAHIRCVHA
jgi:hypothetical protein